MARMYMHISSDKDYEFRVQWFPDCNTLDIVGDGVHLALFATNGQLLELSNAITLYLATEKLKAEQADTSEGEEDE